MLKDRPLGSFAIKIYCKRFRLMRTKFLPFEFPLDFVSEELRTPARHYDFYRGLMIAAGLNVGASVS